MKRISMRWLSLLLVAAMLLTGCVMAEPAKVTTAPAEEDVFIFLPEETESGNTAETAAETPELPEETEGTEAVTEAAETVTEDGEYSSKNEVALYIHLFGHLPGNYIKKNEAQDLGWVSNQGNLWKVAPGKSIGGDRFGNREGLLPNKSGRKYYECDIDFDGSYRNAKRIIFSNDGLIYYTDDHYESFTLLYGEE